MDDAQKQDGLNPNRQEMNAEEIQKQEEAYYLPDTTIKLIPKKDRRRHERKQIFSDSSVAYPASLQ